MAVKGLPDSYRAFVVHFTQTGDTLTFSEFKMRLRSYESTEKNREGDVNADEDNVVKTSRLTSRAQGRGTRRSRPEGARASPNEKEQKWGHTVRRCPDGARERREEHEWDTPQRGQGIGGDHVEKAHGDGDEQDQEDETGTDFFF